MPMYLYAFVRKGKKTFGRYTALGVNSPTRAKCPPVCFVNVPFTVFCAGGMVFDLNFNRAIQVFYESNLERNDRFRTGEHTG